MGRPSNRLQPAPERNELRDDQHGRRQQVVRHRHRPGARDEVRGRELRPKLLGEMHRRQPDGAVPVGPDRIKGCEHIRRRDDDRRGHEEHPRRSVEAIRGGRRSPRVPRPAPGRRRGRTGHPTRRSPPPSSGVSTSSCAPHASRAPSSAAAASDDPPPRPAATGIRLSSRAAIAGAGAGPPGHSPPTAVRVAARARRTRLSAVGPKSKPVTWSVSRSPVASARLSRSASPSGANTEWRLWYPSSRRATTERVRLSLAGAIRTTGARRRVGSDGRIANGPAAGVGHVRLADHGCPGGSARAPRATRATPRPRASADGDPGRCPPSRARQ